MRKINFSKSFFFWLSCEEVKVWLRNYFIDFYRLDFFPRNFNNFLHARQNSLNWYSEWNVYDFPSHRSTSQVFSTMPYKKKNVYVVKRTKKNSYLATLIIEIYKGLLFYGWWDT